MMFLDTRDYFLVLISKYLPKVMVNASRSEEAPEERRVLDAPNVVVVCCIWRNNQLLLDLLCWVYTVIMYNVQAASLNLWISVPRDILIYSVSAVSSQEPPNFLWSVNHFIPNQFIYIYAIESLFVYLNTVQFHTPWRIRTKISSHVP